MQDKKLADHVVRVHREGRPPERNEYDQDFLSSELLRGYIAAAKTYNPVIPQALTGPSAPPWLLQQDFLQLHETCLCTNVIGCDPLSDVEHAASQCPRWTPEAARLDCIR